MPIVAVAATVKLVALVLCADVPPRNEDNNTGTNFLHIQLAAVLVFEVFAAVAAAVGLVTAAVDLNLIGAGAMMVDD